MEVSEKNAKALLNRILARLRAEQPAYTYCNVGVHDVPTECELRLPTVSLDGNVLESRSFKGSGRNKKEATTNAAISAVKAFLEEDWVRGMFEEPTAPTLADAVARTLTREVIRGSPGLEGHWELAQRFNNGWLPLSVLLESRVVQTFFKKSLEPMPNEAALCRLLSDAFRKDCDGVPGFVVDSSKGCVKAEKEVAGRGPGTKPGAIPAFMEMVDAACGRRFEAILVPADLGEDVREVAVEGGGWYLEAIARLLAVQPGDLVLWGRSSKRYITYQFPGDPPPHSTATNNLIRDILKKHMGLEELMQLARRSKATAAEFGYVDPGIDSRPDQGQAGSETPGQGADAAADAGPVKEEAGQSGRTGKAGSVAGSDEACLPGGAQPVELCPDLELGSPFMYGTYRSGGALNLRASWLLGEEVYGPLLLSNVYIRGSEFGTPVMKWDAFPLEDFWRWLPVSSPYVECMRSLYNKHVPLLIRLPDGYRSSSDAGPRNQVSVAAIKRDLGTRGRIQGGLSEESSMVEDLESADACPHIFTVSCTFLQSSEAVVEESEPRPSSMSAQQDAYLKVVKAFQRRWRELFYRDSSLEASFSHWTVEVENPGEDAPPPLPGAVLSLLHKVTCKDLDDTVLEGYVEGSALLRVTWGPGCNCIAPVREALEQIRLGGTAKITVQLPVDPLPVAGPHTRWYTMEIHVTVVKVSNPVMAMDAAVVFKPPIGEQRYNFVLDVLQQYGCRSVADVGCSQGRLLEHMVSKAGQDYRADTYYGLDISSEALLKAARRVTALLEKQRGGSNPAQPQIHWITCDAFSDDAIERGWSGVGSCDAVLMVEVIEHLDPRPLQNTLKVILGAVKPSVVVITTPNSEYNALMLATGVPLQPGTFRNSDHRFEWTRQEFREWMVREAGPFPYSLSFHDIGKAEFTGEALQKLPRHLQHADVGGSTQAAVLVRLPRDPTDVGAVAAGTLETREEAGATATKRPYDVSFQACTAHEHESAAATQGYHGGPCKSQKTSLTACRIADGVPSTGA